MDYADRSLAVFRVHMFGYHVIPVLVLGSRISAWLDLDGCSRSLGALHVFDRLVSLSHPSCSLSSAC